MENEDILLEGLDFDHNTQKFGSEDNARTYDFRIEKMFEEEKMKDPNYKIAKVLAETIVDLVSMNEETSGGERT